MSKKQKENVLALIVTSIATNKQKLFRKKAIKVFENIDNKNKIPLESWSSGKEIPREWKSQTWSQGIFAVNPEGIWSQQSNESQMIGQREEDEDEDGGAKVVVEKSDCSEEFEG